MTSHKCLNERVMTHRCGALIGPWSVEEGPRACHWGTDRGRKREREFAGAAGKRVFVNTSFSLMTHWWLMSRFTDSWSFSSDLTRVCVRNTLSAWRGPAFPHQATSNIVCIFPSIQDEAQQKRWESLTDAGCCAFSVWSHAVRLHVVYKRASVAWFSVWTRETQMCFWFWPFVKQLIHAFVCVFTRSDSFLKGLRRRKANLRRFFDVHAFLTLYHCELMTSARVCLFVWGMFFFFFARLRPVCVFASANRL